MKLAKTKFVKKHGTNVKILTYNSGSFTEKDSKALLGRGSRINTSMRLLESQKEGIFIADDNIMGGQYVENTFTNEVYIVGGTHHEYGINEVISTVANLLVCNNNLTLKGNRKIADGRGNIKTVFDVICSDLPCYLQEVTNELRQFEAGIHPDTEYKVYATAVEVNETDMITISVRGKSEDFKVTAKDYVTFPDLVVIQVARDVRT